MLELVGKGKKEAFNQKVDKLDKTLERRNDKEEKK
jgi:hypothetical protein